MISRSVRRASLAVALQVLAGVPAFAQQPMPGFTSQPVPAAPAAPAAPAPAAAAPAAPAVAPAHLAAAVEYIMASRSTKGFEDDIPKLIDQVRLRFATQRPEIATPINEAALAIISEFVKRRDDLNQRLGVFYARRFSEDELKQLTQFYRSPLGLKLATTQIDIIKDSVPEIKAWQENLTKDVVARIREEVKKKGHNL